MINQPIVFRLWEYIVKQSVTSWPGLQEGKEGAEEPSPLKDRSPEMESLLPGPSSSKSLHP